MVRWGSVGAEWKRSSAASTRPLVTRDLIRCGQESLFRVEHEDLSLRRKSLYKQGGSMVLCEAPVKPDEPPQKACSPLPYVTCLCTNLLRAAHEGCLEARSNGKVRPQEIEVHQRRSHELFFRCAGDGSNGVSLDAFRVCLGSVALKWLARSGHVFSQEAPILWPRQVRPGTVGCLKEC